MAYVASTTNRDVDTVQAAGCLIHYNGVVTDADSIDLAATPTTPYEFLGGNQNPVPGAVGQPVLVSDSLVTIPVIDATVAPPATPFVTVIGFLQVFLNPQQTVLPFPLTAPPASAADPQIPATIINMAGCGTSTAGNPILGNGASPVAVRLISPP